MSDDPKSVSTVAATAQILSILKDIGLAVLVAFLQFTKSKAKAADNKVAVLETEKKVEELKHEVDTRLAGKSDRDVILEFVGRKRDSSDGQGS